MLNGIQCQPLRGQVIAKNNSVVKFKGDEESQNGRINHENLKQTADELKNAAKDFHPDSFISKTCKVLGAVITGAAMAFTFHNLSGTNAQKIKDGVTKLAENEKAKAFFENKFIGAMKEFMQKPSFDKLLKGVRNVVTFLVGLTETIHEVHQSGVFTKKQAESKE